MIEISSNKILTLKKLLRKILNYGPIYSIITSHKTLYIITFFLRFVPGNLSRISHSKIFSKLNYQKKIDTDSLKINRKLLLHYDNSYNAKAIRKALGINSRKTK